MHNIEDGICGGGKYHYISLPLKSVLKERAKSYHLYAQLLAMLTGLDCVCVCLCVQGAVEANLSA